MPSSSSRSSDTKQAIVRYVPTRETPSQTDRQMVVRSHRSGHSGGSSSFQRSKPNPRDDSVEKIKAGANTVSDRLDDIIDDFVELFGESECSDEMMARRDRRNHQ